MNLITGASGMVGSAVMEEACKAKLPIKAMYRNPDEAKRPGADVATVIADYADKESLRKTFDGIAAVYLVCSPMPQLAELESNAIEVCTEKRVGHVVLSSSLGAEDYPKSFPSWHRKVEEKLKASGLQYTILRPNSFMQNLLTAVAPSVRAKGAFHAAMGDAKVSYIDVQDIGAVVAKVLGGPQAHAGKTYELNGPEAFSDADVAARISRVTGRKVEFVDIPESTQRAAMLGQGMPEWLITALLDLQRYYTVEGKGGEVDDVLGRLLGRAPVMLDQFLERNKESFREQTASA